MNLCRDIRSADSLKERVWIERQTVYEGANREDLRYAIGCGREVGAEPDCKSLMGEQNADRDECKKGERHVVRSLEKKFSRTLLRLRVSARNRREHYREDR